MQMLMTAAPTSTSAWREKQPVAVIGVGVEQ